MASNATKRHNDNHQHAVRRGVWVTVFAATAVVVVVLMSLPPRSTTDNLPPSALAGSTMAREGAGRDVAIFDRVAKVIVETLKVDRDKVTPASRFEEDLNADSLDRLTLLMQLEVEFGRKIPDEDAKGLTTVQAVLDYLAARGA